MGRRDADGDGMGQDQRPSRLYYICRNGAARPASSSRNIAVLVFSTISGDQFLSWGWRVPFWLSIVMVAVGLYIRLGILETPVFQRILDMQQTASAPVIEVIRRQPKEII